MTATAARPPTILLIEDDAEVRYSLSRVLTSHGYAVSEAASGELGVAAIRKGPAPDLVFLDVRMTGMGGIETLQHIRSAQPKQLVVLMTAFGTAQTAIEAMKYGAFDYIMKPFDPAKVLPWPRRRSRPMPTSAPPATTSLRSMLMITAKVSWARLRSCRKCSSSSAR